MLIINCTSTQGINRVRTGQILPFEYELFEYIGEIGDGCYIVGMFLIFFVVATFLCLCCY